MLRSFLGAADRRDAGGLSAATVTLRGQGIDARMLHAPADAFPMWLIDISRSRPQQVAGLLSAAERERALRYKTETLRNRYAIAHGSLRAILRDIYGLPIEGQDLSENEFGKPFLKFAPQLRFSISYSASFALIGVNEGSAIGVDIESMRTIADADDLAAIHYTPREQSELRAGEPSEVELSRRFLSIWVKKEACVKALGRGLGIPLDQLECGGTDQVSLVQMPDRQCLRTGIIQIGGDPIVGWARSLA